MNRLVLASIVVFSVSTGLGQAGARPPEGGYFGFGLGYGAASGDRAVALKPGDFEIPAARYDELVRTDFGSGLAFDLRFGWLVGPVAPEISLAGHGTFDFQDGAGYAIGGYTPEGEEDGKGWSGWALTFGLGATYDLSARVRIGLDLRMVMPMYGTFMIDWDDDKEAEPEETPSTFVFMPTLQIVASF